MKKSAVCYLRSSKDRSDVSIDAQRRALQVLAAAKELSIVGEFVDVVLSGKDDNRPGFQALLRALKSRERGWNAILVMDTSRIARNVNLAGVFGLECEKRGVRVLYEKLPETNPMVDMVMRQIWGAFDQLHSMMSREKGLAGMAENVRRGFRAGGRAPTGYRLQKIETGAVREGLPVTKTKLIAGPELPAIARYLKGRAKGLQGARLARELKLELSATTLVGIEWNALTYAGHTVWNMRTATAPGGGHVGNVKRRPRAEWLMERGTHEACITDEDAEAILARLERPRRTRDRGDGYLFSGILRAPGGRAWHGNSGFYRLGGRNVSAELLEPQILERIRLDMAGPSFARALLDQARAATPAPTEVDELLALERRKAEKEAAIAKISGLLDQTTAPRPLLERIELLEGELREIASQAAMVAEEARLAKRLAEVTELDVRAFLRAIADELGELDRGALKDFLRQLLDQVVLDPASPTCTLHYRVVLGGDKVASPQGFERNPTLRGTSEFTASLGRWRHAA